MCARVCVCVRMEHSRLELTLRACSLCLFFPSSFLFAFSCACACGCCLAAAQKPRSDSLYESAYECTVTLNRQMQRPSPLRSADTTGGACKHQTESRQ